MASIFGTSERKNGLDSCENEKVLIKQRVREEQEKSGNDGGRGTEMGQNENSDPVRSSNNVTKRKSNGKEGNVGHFTAVDATKLRKYLVLLQDCLAIKFVPSASDEPCHCSAATNAHDDQERETDEPSINQERCGSRMKRKSDPTGGSGKEQHFIVNPEPSSTLNSKIRPCSTTWDVWRAERSLKCQEIEVGSSKTEIVNSLHGLYLFKAFRESNLTCFWNSAIRATFQNIEYKGYIVPSTILITAFPRYLSILRTAWSRKMLRSPLGYQIEFIGEIEDMIADPVQQSQFAPLSDSLCWAILELTSKGQEAFVDSITEKLRGAFPTMVLPHRELIYQTLEKLIRERKVYQTSHGYFVVTPDTLRYMSLTSCSQFHHEPSQQFAAFTATVSQATAATTTTNNTSLTLDALLNPRSNECGPLSLESSYWNSVGEASGRDEPSDVYSSLEVENAEANEMKRHNSLKIFRRGNPCNASNRSEQLLKNRRFSLKLTKAKRNEEANENEPRNSSTLDNLSRAMKSLKMTSNKQLVRKKSRKKNKSLFKRIFPFGRSSSSGEDSALSSMSDTSSPELKPRSNMQRSMSTQTSSDNLKCISLMEDSQLTTGAIKCSSPSSSPRYHDKLGTHCSEISDPTDTVGADYWRDSSYSHRSMSVLDDGRSNSPIYDVLANPSKASDALTATQNVHFPPFNGLRGESSRCSTLSSQAASSLGYGSQVGQHSCSPCPSPSATYVSIKESGQEHSKFQNRGTASRSSYYDYYKRRYPIYPSHFDRRVPQYRSLINSSEAKRDYKSSKSSSLLRETEARSNKKCSPDKTEYENRNESSSTTKGRSPEATTTTVTQNIKSNTNMELELQIPVSSVMKAALQAKKDNMKAEAYKQIMGDNDGTDKEVRKGFPKTEKISVNLEKAGAKISVSEPKTTTEVKTKVESNGVLQKRSTVIRNNDSKPSSGLQSTVEIKCPGTKEKNLHIQVNGKEHKLQYSPTTVKVTCN